MSDLMFSIDQNQEFLTDEQIRKACPVAFTEKASNEVSQHYTHIPTNQHDRDWETSNHSY